MDQLIEFATKHPLLVSAAAITGALLLYNEIRMAGTGKFAISPDQAVRLMNKGALVLDLRTPEEYAAGHLAGAKNVELKNLDDGVAALKRGKPVITYDERGGGTQRAIARLRQADFEHVYSLRGGVAAWRSEHMPLEKTGGKS